MAAFNGDRTLVALKVMVKKSFNSQPWQDFGSSESYDRQECQFLKLMGFWWLSKLQSARMLTPTVDTILAAFKAAVGRNFNSNFWHGFGSYEIYGQQEFQLPLLTWLLYLLKLKSASTVGRILVALKATSNRNVNSHCWQEFGSSENYV